jgi:hypothetical protein
LPNCYFFSIVDAHITEEGIDEDADYIHPFRGAVERESAAGRPKVWFPLLGENQTVQLKRIYDLINPAEICPLLPAPSVNPRRGDELVMEYRELLFDQLRVEARNFIYASETNAFEAYRQLRRAILHYGKALKPLGGSNAVISANSSKLLSVGALLAAYELKRSRVNIAIAHVEAHGYTMRESEASNLDELANESRLHCTDDIRPGCVSRLSHVHRTLASCSIPRREQAGRSFNRKVVSRFWAHRRHTDPEENGGLTR